MIRQLEPLNPPPATTYLLTLRALAERRKTRQLSTDDALAAAEQLRRDYAKLGVKPFPNILNAHLQLCGTMHEARAVLDQYPEAKCARTATTCNLLVRLCTGLAEAATVVREMIQAGVTPNTTTLNSMLSVCGKGEVTAALTLAKSLAPGLVANANTVETLAKHVGNRAKAEARLFAAGYSVGT